MEDEHKDKKSSLVVMGIFEVIGGVLCALLALVTMIPLVLTPGKIPVQQIMPGMLVYLFLSVWLIWMGIGTIRACRWARILMLVASWLALASGVLAMGMMFFVLPKSFAGAAVPDAMVIPMMIVTSIILTVFYVLIPAFGIVFYGGRNVRATFEHCNPIPSWLEQCPLPVLALALMLALSVVSMTMLCFVHCAIPFFGIILSGWAGAIVLLGGFGICGLLAVGVFKLRPAAWWGTLALLLLGVTSQMITYSRIDMADYYMAIGYTDQMLQQMTNMGWSGTTFQIMGVIYALPALAYLLWLKRYFKTNLVSVDARV